MFFGRELRETIKVIDTGVQFILQADDFENPKVKAAAQSVEVGGMELASAAKAHEVPPELLACALHWAKQGPVPRDEEVKTCKMVNTLFFHASSTILFVKLKCILSFLKALSSLY